MLSGTLLQKEKIAISVFNDLHQVAFKNIGEHGGIHSASTALKSQQNSKLINYHSVKLNFNSRVAMLGIDGRMRFKLPGLLLAMCCDVT